MATAAAEQRQPELGGQPAAAGDALGPDQPVGAGLQLAGDQRRAPEGADAAAGATATTTMPAKVRSDRSVPWSGWSHAMSGDGRPGAAPVTASDDGEPRRPRPTTTAACDRGTAARSARSSGHLQRGPAVAVGGPAHVGQDEVLQAERGRPSRPGRGSGPSVRTSSVRLPVGVAGGDDVLAGRQRAGSRRGAGEPVVGGQQRRRRRRRPAPGSRPARSGGRRPAPGRRPGARTARR